MLRSETQVASDRKSLGAAVEVGALVEEPFPADAVRVPPTGRTGVWELLPRSQNSSPPATTAAITSQSVVPGRFMGCSS